MPTAVPGSLRKKESFGIAESLAAEVGMVLRKELREAEIENLDGAPFGDEKYSLA